MIKIKLTSWVLGAALLIGAGVATQVRAGLLVDTLPGNTGTKNVFWSDQWIFSVDAAFVVPSKCEDRET